MLIIPAIDLKNGECVRLRQGDMEQASVFSKNPVDMAAQWVEQGAERLHLVDLDGAFAGKPKHFDVISEIIQTFPQVPVQVGGGIRDLETIEQYKAIGVDTVILGTIALKSPEFVAKACEAFPGHIMVGIDAKDGFVAVEGWAEVSTMPVIDLAKKFESLGVQAIIYTDIARDGMMQGVNVVATSLLASAVDIPIVASGGVAGLDDIQQLLDEPVNFYGVITGRAIYEGGLDFKQALELASRRG